MYRRPTFRTRGRARACALILALACCAALLAAAPLAAQEPPALPPGPEEPNNSFGAAAWLPLAEPLQATIYPKGDADWFELYAEQQGELTIAVTGAPATLDISLRLWNSNRDTVSGWFAPTAVGGDVTAVVDLAEPGRYVIELVDGSSDADADTPYTLTATLIPTADEAEPNNRFGEAAWLPEGGEVRANILPAGDADWYRLDVPDAGELMVTVGDVDAEMAVSMRVWNAERDTISGWFAPLRAGGDTQALVDLPHAGSYFLELVAEGRSPLPYLLEWEFTEANDLSEPNNSFGTAAWLPFDEPRPATILPRGDADWFLLEAPAPGELRFDVTNVPGALDIDLRVWNSNRDTISGWFAPLAAGGDTTGFVDLPAAGHYALEVADGNYDARAIAPYTITLSFTEAQDPGEPNDSFGRASSLEVGMPVPATILPRGDADWHVLELPHLGELTVTVTDVPEELDISLRVWNSNRDTISGWFGPLARGGDTVAVVDIPRAGRYSLEVADGNYDARSVEPFTLLADFIPAADTGEPNEAQADATPIDLDAPVDAALLPAGDADWYRVEVGEAGDLYLLITNVADNLTPALRVRNEAGEVIANWAYPLAAGGDTEAVAPIAEAGVYFIEVVDNQRARSIEPYRLVASLSEIDAETVAALAPAEPAAPEEAAPEATEEAAPEATEEAAPEATEEVAPEATEEAAPEATEEVAEEATEAVTPEAAEETTPEEAAVPEEVTEEVTPEATEEAAAPPSASTGRRPPGASPAPPAEGAAGEDEGAAGEAATTGVPGVTLPISAGWLLVEQEGALWLGPAADEATLLAETPSAPRIVVVLADDIAGADPAALVEAAIASGDFDLIEEPAPASVGGMDGVSIGIEQGAEGARVRQRLIFVAGSQGAYQFLLEAPAAQWEDALPLLEGVLEGAVIE